MNQDRQILTLLLVENGAGWPSWIGELRARAPNVVVEAQLENESIEVFGQRVLLRLERLLERQDRVLGAAYVCGLGSPSHDAVRERICRALLEVLDKSSNAELILGGVAATDSRSAEEERSRLLRLWTRLSEHSPHHPLSIRFDEDEDESGVFEALGSLEPSPSLRFLG